MTATQLLQKLSEAFTSRLSSNNPQLDGSCAPSMQRNCNTEVVAEVLPLTLGSRNGSMCSASSNSDGEAQLRLEQASWGGSNTTLFGSSSAALLACKSTPLPSLASQPATARALRARGKAMLRTEAGLPGLITSLTPSELDTQQQLSLESRSSMMDAITPSNAPYSPSSCTVLPSYMWSATAPLPSTLQTTPGTLTAVQQHALAGRVQAAPPLTLLDDDDDEGDISIIDDDEGDADDLVHPMSPAAAEAAGTPEHCLWEDGVIASWLQGTELLDDGDDCKEESDQQPAAAVRACSKAAAVAGSLHESLS